MGEYRPPEHTPNITTTVLDLSREARKSLEQEAEAIESPLIKVKITPEEFAFDPDKRYQLPRAFYLVDPTWYRVGRNRELLSKIFPSFVAIQRKPGAVGALFSGPSNVAKDRLNLMLESHIMLLPLGMHDKSFGGLKVIGQKINRYSTSTNGFVFCNLHFQVVDVFARGRWVPRNRLDLRLERLGQPLLISRARLLVESEEIRNYTDEYLIQLEGGL